MHLVIHDASLRKVAFVDNTKQTTLKYIKYEWYRSLETAGSTFTVTIQKRAIQTDNHYEVAYNHLNERSFITFKAKNKTHLFSVMVVTENEETITCECESANLELINEYANPYKATKAMTFVEYCNAMGLLSFTYLTIGLNEVSDKSLTLEWEGQDTKLARLLSLANKFDAEIEFDTRLNADSSIKQFILNVYHENDDKHQGVGRIREDVQLVYGKNIKSVTRTIDKTNVVNAIRPTGTKDGNTVVISGLGAWEEKNADGVVEFYQKGEMLYAPISMQLYPSTFTHDTINDQWTRKDIAVDSDNPTVIRAEGIKALKRLAYPSITYEVDGFFDGEIGDTVKVIDNGFVPKLILKARVIEQYIYDDETKNKTVLGNFTALENRLSDGIQARLNELVEQAKPYTIKLSTDNGVVFKNNIGQSIVTPTLYKGGQPVVTDVTWRWALDGNVTTGMTYTVRGEDVTDTATLTVSAYVGNDEVAVDEVSFVNVFDGTDGQTSYHHWAYSENADGTGLSFTDNGQRYQGYYTDYVQADSTDKNKYRWADRWAKIPEDIQADIDSKADQALTQEQINALNGKNQILEAELQAKASLNTFSEFEKAYQSFVTSNAEGQAKAEADLIEAGRRIEMLTTQFGGLAELKTFIDTYMSSSNEGLIIGKNDASSTIKVSSDRISMFSAGKEVMYISQGVIHIDNGIFTASVQIGKFRTEQYHLNADINVVRYVG